MLEALDGKPITGVPHLEDFEHLIRRLGQRKTEAIRRYLDRIIDEMPPDEMTGLRKFGSSQFGRELEPWRRPLDELWKEAQRFLGEDACEEDAEDRAALWFGLFLWERMIARDERWVFWDPNLSHDDPNRDPVGKVYFECSDDA